MPTFRDPVYHMGGVPVQSEFPFVVGNVYFVSSVAGSSAYNGKTKDTPFNTFARAMEFTTTNDCVILMPGHTENITSTGVFDIDQAGMIVWGLGEYDYRPTFTHNTAAAYAQITAANVWLHNVKFVAGTTATATGLLVAAKGAKITNCRFEEVLASTYTYNETLITGATASEADGLVVANCEFYQLAGGSPSSGAIIISGAHNDVKITNNRLYGGWTTGGCIVAGTTAAIYGLEITHNLISNSQSSGTKSGIAVLSDAGQGVIAYNCVIAAGTSGQDLGLAIKVSASGTMGVFENYVAGRPAESGRLDPGVFSTA